MGGRTKERAALQLRQQHAAEASVVGEDQEQPPHENEDLLFRVEQRLRECTQDELQQRKQQLDLARDPESYAQEEDAQASAAAADSAFRAQRGSSSKAIWLTQRRGVSAADASAALKCLEVLRECVLQSNAAAATCVSSGSSSCGVRLPVYLYTLLQCLRREAAAAKDSSTACLQESVTDGGNAGSRITGGMALLLVLLLQELSPERLHKTVHSDPKLLVLLLQAVDACSVAEEAAEATSGGCSPRPVLLLLAALQQCFSVHRQQYLSADRLAAPPNSGSSNSSSSSLVSNSDSSNRGATGSSCGVCSCFPARGVWLQLLKLLTQDARACVRHRARQTAQSLLYAAAAAAGAPAAPGAAAEAAAETAAVGPSAAAGAASAGNLKHQQYSRASLGACVSVLQDYLIKGEQFSGNLFSPRREEQALQKTYFLRALPFLRRVLASLLQLPLCVGSSHQSSNGNRGNETGKDDSSNDVRGRSSSCGSCESVQSTRQTAQAGEGHYMLLHAVQKLCMRTAFLSQSGAGFTVEAAQALRCVVDAVAEALQQQLVQPRVSASREHQQGDGDELQASCSDGADGSARFAALTGTLLLPVAGQLLSGLLQQQCGSSTCRSSHVKRSSDDMTVKEEDGSSSSSSRSGGVWIAASAAAGSLDPACSTTEKGRSSSSVALSEAAAQARGTLGTAGAAQYAAAWCGAVSATLDVLTQWTGLPEGGETVQRREGGADSSRESHKKSLMTSAGRKGTREGLGRSSNSGGGESSSRTRVSVNDEETETALLLEQLQRLTLLPREAQGALGDKEDRRNTLQKATATPTGVSTAAATDGDTARSCAAGTAAAAGGAGGGGVAANSSRRHPYASRAEIFSRAWKRVLKCLCEGLAAVRDSSVAAAVAAAGRRLVEQATVLELPLLDAAVPYCLALLHYKQKQQWHEGLQQAAQLFRSVGSVGLKQFSRGSPCFPQLQQLSCSLVRLQLHQGHQQHHQQPLGQQQQPAEGKLTEYMDAYVDLHRDAFAPLLERVVTMLALVETGALPENSSNSSGRNGSVHVSGVLRSNNCPSSASGSAEESRGLLASLQRRDLALYRGDIRSCFAAALHAFTCRVLMSKSLLPLVFFVEVRDLAPTDLVVFDERAAAAQAAEFCRISDSGRSRAVEWCSNSWLLPVLPTCLKRDRLGLFAVYFFPLAQQLQQQARHALAAGKPLLARELCRLQQQVWGLLPGFCCQPLDLPHALSSQQGAKLFDAMLQLLHEPVLRQDICASIVNLCAAVAVPPCAAAAAAAVVSSIANPAATSSAGVVRTGGHGGVHEPRTAGDVAAAAAPAGADTSAAAAAQSNRRRAAALAAVLRAAEQMEHSSHGDDEAIAALAAVAGSACRDGRRLLQMRAAPVIGFLVVRFLQLHKLPAAGTAGGPIATGAVGTRGTATPQQQRSFLAAMLLGETESLENLTQSAKMKATQHLLRAIKAYAPLCPKELLQANVRRFTSAFLNRATVAAAALGGAAAGAVPSGAAETAGAGSRSGAAATAVLGPTETAALVDITDALLPVLCGEFTVEVVGVMQNLLAICVESLKKQPGSRSGAAASLAAEGRATTVCNPVEALVHRQVLQMLLRRAYKTLKHVLERSLERLQQSSQHAEQFAVQQLQQPAQQEQQQPSQPPHQKQEQDLPPQLPAQQGHQTPIALQEQAATGNSSLNTSDGSLTCGGEKTLLLSCELLMDLWKVLEPGRAVSWAASAEKARLGCLRVFICYCLSAQAHAERSACTSTGDSSCGVVHVLPSTAPPAAGASRANEDAAAEWGTLLEKTLPVLVPEILLCLKTPNRVVRETALDALSAVAEACEHDREKLSNLVLGVAAGLGGCFEGDPPLLKAAASLALSRLVFSFSEEMGEDLVTEVADVVLVMLEDDNTPAFLGALHFAKVLVHVLDPGQLEPFLPRILNLFESKAVTRARMKIRRLLEKLIKKLGDAAVEAAFPQKHLALLRHLQRRMRKQQLRDLLCNAALQEGLSWEDLDFGNSSSSKKEETQQPSGQSAKHSRRKHAKERFAATLEEDEEDEDDEESEDEEEESGTTACSQKVRQKKGTGISPSGKTKVSQGDAATHNEKGVRTAAGAKLEQQPTSIYLQELLDAAEEKDVFEKTEGRKRARRRTAAKPLSLAQDPAGDTPVDLLSPAAAERVLVSTGTNKRRRQGTLYLDGSAAIGEGATRRQETPVAKEEVYWNEEGRLVVVDGEDGHKKGTGKRLSSGATAEPDAKEQTVTHPRQLARQRPGERARENKRPTLSCLAARRAAAKAARQQKRGGHFVQQGGEAFKSKKARGDVMKNKKIEPYAYIRLNPAMIREKYRPKALKSLSTVFIKPTKRASISSTSRGVQKRPQNRSRRSKKK